MASTLNPYLTFQGDARQAMEFYRGVFDAEVTFMTFGEQGGAGAEAPADGIMHSELKAPNGIVFMASDAMDYEPGARISMSLSGDNAGELRTYFERLSAGGQVTQPLMEAPWGDTFGIAVDRFGISWLFNISGHAGS